MTASGGVAILVTGLFFEVGVVVMLGPLGHRSPTLDAFLVAIVVSLLVNDSPVHVLAFGALMTAPLMSWETVRRARRTAA